MYRRHPAPIEHIPVSLGIYTQLRLASAFTNDEKEVWEIVEEAVDQWMRLHGPGTIPGPATGGVQWKRLFLPNGTLMRTVFNGKNYHSMVEADALNYDGNAISPSGFVNAVGGIRRNAWKCIWLLFPDSKEWKLADSLRTKERPRRTRRFPPAPRHEPAMRPFTTDIPAVSAPSAASAASAASAVAAVPAASAAPAAYATTPPLRVAHLIEPVLAQPARPASAAPHAHPAKDAAHDDESLAHPAGDRRRNHRTDANTRHVPAGPAYRIDRRAPGEDRLAALLQELLPPLLLRLCASNAAPPGAISPA